MYNLINIVIKGENSYYFIDYSNINYLQIINFYNQNKTVINYFSQNFKQLSEVEFAEYEQDNTNLNYSLEINEDEKYTRVYNKDFKIIYEEKFDNKTSFFS